MTTASVATDVLVSTDWVENHHKDAGVVLVEVDVDTKAYDDGHIPGAVGWNWQTQLCDTVQRDVIGQEALQRLLGLSGIANDTTIVLYGDNNNWFAAWALWQLELYGHKDVRIMDGGRKKWLAETRPLTKDKPKTSPCKYTAKPRNDALRAYRPEIERALETAKGMMLIDVRSPDEFTGKILAPEGMNETCQRGGHIPGARSIPWSKACNDDGTFKSPKDLEKLYAGEGVTPDKTVVTYCRIGERSSHTWFVLKHLLGYRDVKNYDGSWTEWGNLVGAPVAIGEAN